MEQHCDNGKVIYVSAHAANVQIKSLSRRPGAAHRHKYGVYKCGLCNCFHITTVTKRRQTPEKLDKYPIDFKRSGNLKTKKKKK